MKKLLALTALMSAVNALAATYYVSDCQSGAVSGCTAGNDANTSTQAQNPATPWRTLAPVFTIFSSLAAGDQVLLARGGKWTDGSAHSIVNANGTEANPIYVGAYDPSWVVATINGTATTGVTSTTITDSGAAFPTSGTGLTGYFVETQNYFGRLEYLQIASNTATVLTLSTAWEDGGVPPIGKSYKIVARRPDTTYTGAAGNSLFQTFSNNQKGWKFEDLTITSTGGGQAFAWWGNSSAMTINRVTMDGGGIFIAAGSVGSTHSSKFTLTSSILKNMTGMCILIGADNQLIQGNQFRNCATDASVGNHHIYLQCVVSAAGNPRPCLGALVDNNDVLDNASNSCDSVQIVQHDLYQSLTISRNRLRQTGVAAGGACYGIELAKGNNTTDIEGCIGCRINDNYLGNLGHIFINASQTRFTRIYNNFIVQLNPLGGSRDTYGISIGEVAFFDSNKLAQTNVQVYNNTMYVAGINDSPSYAVRWRNDGHPSGVGTGHVFTGNVISFSASVAATYFFDWGTGYSASNFSSWDYNNYYTFGTSTTQINPTQSTLAAFTAATGLDTNGVTGNPTYTTTPTMGGTDSCKFQAGSPDVNTCSSSFCSRLAYRSFVPLSTRDRGACDGNNQ